MSARNLGDSAHVSEKPSGSCGSCRKDVGWIDLGQILAPPRDSTDQQLRHRESRHLLEGKEHGDERRDGQEDATNHGKRVDFVLPVELHDVLTLDRGLSVVLLGLGLLESLLNLLHLRLDLEHFGLGSRVVKEDSEEQGSKDKRRENDGGPPVHFF